LSKAKLNIKILFIILIGFIFLTLVITSSLLNRDKVSHNIIIEATKAKAMKVQSIATGEEDIEEVEFERQFKGPLIH